MNETLIFFHIRDEFKKCRDWSVSLHNIVTDVQDCDIVVSSNSSHAITLTVRPIPLGKYEPPYPLPYQRIN